MKPIRQLAAVAALVTVAGCGRSPAPTDLFLTDTRLIEAEAAGRDQATVVAAGRRGLWINDVLQRGFASGPPGRLRFRVDIPKRARLHVTCAIDPHYWDRPGVEFSVRVRSEGRETTVFSQLLDPIARTKDRGFVPIDADLGRFAGRDRELLLETHGYEKTDDPRWAFWGAPAITTEGAMAPLVIIYLVDTLRADHTGVYGYSRPTTPELDAFAEDAVVFERAIAHASWTKPSVASILTSHLPAQHRAVQLRDALDSKHPTLARRLAEHGFSTGAAMANSVIYGAEAAFDPGFESFVGLHTEDDRRSKLVGADVVVDAALDFLRSKRGLPSFLYVHTMDPHVPYVPPAPFDCRFGPFPAPGHPAQDPRTDYKEPLDRERMIGQYDGDIAFGDQEFGRFLRELKSWGRYRDALIVFVADHGEEFLDHGLWLHGRSLFDELIHVPLLVKFPGNAWAGRRVAAQVQGVDIVPTVLESLELPLGSDLVGAPLQQVIRGETRPRPALAEISHRGFVAHGVRTEEDKYIRRFSPDDDQLYFDLVRDPGERTNRADEQPERVRELQTQAETGMARNPFRYLLQLAGSSRFVLRLETRGWIENVEAEDFGSEEGWTLGGNGRWLEIAARPRPGTRRQLAFGLRPIGVPVRLSGRRDGRALHEGDVVIGETAFRPRDFPFRLPDVESETETGRSLLLFAPPPPRLDGVRIWLRLLEGHTIQELDADTRERLKALGYVGP